MKKTVTKLLDEIMAILDRDGRTVADLAKDLGRDYNHVYDWMVRRKFNPSSDALMELMNWRDKHKPAAAASAATG